MASEWHGQIVDGHLGGYVPGGDPGTFAPGTWRYLIDRYDVKSVLDVGCGDGTALDWFAAQGLQVEGIDGMDTGHPRVVVHDYATGYLTGFEGIVHPNPEFDLCWCAEFVEHVEEEHVPHFLRDFQRARVVAMTHAWPGQGGWHHVNEQIDSYWRGVMAGAGFTLDGAATAAGRLLAAREDVPSLGNYVYRSLLVYRKV